MSFADSGVRTVLSGTGPVTVTFAGDVVEGGLVGYSGGWVAADGNPTIAARFVAAKSYASGATGVVYQMARVNGFTGGTAGNAIYLSDTAGQYSDSAGTYTQSLGFMVTATEAMIMPFDLSGATMATVTDGTITLAKLEDLTDGYIIVGSSGDVPTAVAMSGDVTILNTGATAIAGNSIVNADVKTTAAIAHSKLAAMTAGYILVGNGSAVPVAVAVSGDLTMGNDGTAAIASDVIVNADVNSAAAIAFSKLATLASGNLLIGSAGGVATSVAMSGDVTIVAAGTTSIASDVIMNADINTAAAIALTKLAPMTAGTVLMGASTTIPTATAITGDIGLTNAGVASITGDSIVNADVKTTAAIAHSKLAAMTSGYVLVGSAGTVPTAVGMTGDVTIVASGATTIGAGAVDPAMMAAMTSGYIIVGGSGTVPAAVAMSGDVTIAAGGATTIAAGAVDPAMMSTSARTQTVRGQSFDIDVVGAATYDEVILVPATGIEILEFRVVYEKEQSGTVAGGNYRAGTAAGGEQIFAASTCALEDSKAVGWTHIPTPVEYTVAADQAIFVRFTGVAATQAGVVHLEMDYETTD